MIFQLSPAEVVAAAPFLHSMLTKKRKALENVFEKATHRELSVLMRMLLLAGLRKQKGLHFSEESNVRRKKKSIRKWARTPSMIKDTLGSREKLRLALRPFLRVIQPVIRLFVTEDTSDGGRSRDQPETAQVQ